MSRRSEEPTPLDPGLEAALDKLNRVPPRDPQAAVRGRAAFLAQAQAMRTSASSHTSTHTLALPTRSILRLLCLALAAIGALIVAGAIAMLAAQASQPNDALYPVKLLSEEARLALTFDERRQLDLLLEFSNRRLAELQSAKEGAATLRDVFVCLEKHVSQAAEIAARLGDVDAGQAESLMQIRDRTERLRRMMQQPQGDASSGRASP